MRYDTKDEQAMTREGVVVAKNIPDRGNSKYKGREVSGRPGP